MNEQTRPDATASNCFVETIVGRSQQGLDNSAFNWRTGSTEQYMAWAGILQSNGSTLRAEHEKPGRGSRINTGTETIPRQAGEQNDGQHEAQNQPSGSNICPDESMPIAAGRALATIPLEKEY